MEISIKTETPDVSPADLDSFALAMHHVRSDTDNNEWENMTDSCVKLHRIDFP